MLHHALLYIAAGLLSANLTVAQHLEVDVDAVKKLVTKWNRAHSLHRVDSLSPLYADKIDFYGTMLSRGRCVARKRIALEDVKDFRQTITTSLSLSGYSSGVIRCDFVKKVTGNNTSASYDAYLVIKKISGRYLIVGESDLATDRRLNHTPNIGSKMSIKEGQHDHEKNWLSGKDTSAYVDIILLGGTVALGVAGLLVAFRTTREPVFALIQRSIGKDTREDLYEKGLSFEKFVVQQFNIHKDFFTLLDWRSDKIHDGVAPLSNRNPDLVYRYRCKNFVRTFAVECKYRRKTYKQMVQLMDESKFRTYAAFHTSEMPVYIALGLSGPPDNPKELYLIPFQEAKLTMSREELSRYRKSKKFFYDMERDRLT